MECILAPCEGLFGYGKGMLVGNRAAAVCSDRLLFYN